jgi:hypothetical protein
MKILLNETVSLPFDKQVPQGSDNFENFTE